MRPISISTYGFPGALSEVVTRSIMTLPPLTDEQGRDFLRNVLGMVTSIFWANFLSDLSDDAKQEISAVMEGEDEAAYEACFQKYCNIMGDKAAEQRANRVIGDLAAKLPALMQQEYSQFRAEINA